MTVIESLREAKINHWDEKEIITNLQEKCGLKLSEALDVCKEEFGDDERFIEAAFDLRAHSLPSSGKIRPDGVTVVTDEWED